MNRTTSNPPANASQTARPKGGSAKDDRLKAALKANMARRKAQARARTGQGSDSDPTNTNEE